MRGDNPDRSKPAHIFVRVEKAFTGLQKENKELRKLLRDILAAVDAPEVADDLLLFFQLPAIKKARYFFEDEKEPT